MAAKRICDGTCKRFRVKKPVGGGRYSAGQARCQQCDVWIDHRGAHTKDGSAAAAVNSEGWFCNCCNYRVRRKPRNTEYKAKAKSASNSQDGSGIDLSYITKRRARMIKYVARCIPPHKGDFDRQEFEDSLRKYATHVSSVKSGGHVSGEPEGSVRKHAVSVSSMEREFNAPIETIIDLAYEKTPANRIFMMVELERACSALGRVPTRQEFEGRHSALRMSQYEDEFGSWERMIERLGYDPFYRDRKTGGGGHAAPANPGRDGTESGRVKKMPPDGTGIDVLNQRIWEASSLIKASPGGVCLSNLKMLLNMSQDEASGLAVRLKRIDGMSSRTVLQRDGTPDAVLRYDAPDGSKGDPVDSSGIDPDAGRMPESDDDRVKDGQKEKRDENRPCHETSVGKDIGVIARLVLEEHGENSKRIDKSLQRSLTMEFLRVRSIRAVAENHPEISREVIKRHVRTPLRLPDALRARNEEGLHPDPEISLQIALYAVNHHDWDGRKDSADDVVRTAEAIAGQILADRGSRHPVQNTADQHKRGREPDAACAEDVPTPTAVWIATATLHTERGNDSIFTARDIIDRVVRQNLCSSSHATVMAYVLNHCVANAPNHAGSGHRKTYRTGPGAYRLYRRGDPCHPDRKNGMIAPLPFQIPEQYRDLRRWYDEEYCG